ncbi:MAG: glycosyltransferase family 4 protein, partial [Deltaproteobacteria bacterium]|nr:glycosyltransferase family 4 protein [Deltaproteobacteria bacterium]
MKQGHAGFLRRPVRLAFLLQDLKFGGTQTQTLELASRLDRSRFHPEIWLLIAGDDLAPAARQRGLELVWISRQPRVNPICLARLWRHLKRQPVDLLMLLTVVPNVWGRILGRLAGVPLIIGNCRGGAPQRQHERWLWPLAHHLISNSRAEKAFLTDRCRVPRHRVTVIPNGVDVEYFSPWPADDPPHRLVILSVGRLVRQKGHDTLLAAFRRVARQIPQAELWIVGEGPRLPALEDQAGHFLASGRIRLLPPRGDLRPLFQEATLFVLASNWEGLPNVILEAMAAGLPVVATEVGGVPEAVVPGRTGWLVPPGDPEALAEAIREALAAPETRKTFGRQARQRVKHNFSLADMARRHE